MGHPLIEFGEHMVSSNEPIEVGETWSLENGWRVYMRCGLKAVVMKPRAMRRLGEMYCTQPGAHEEVRTIGRNMIEAANAAKEKNDRHEIPEDAAAFALPRGTA